jgi:hypothetical protein
VFDGYTNKYYPFNTTVWKALKKHVRCSVYDCTVTIDVELHLVTYMKLVAKYVMHVR